MKCSDGNVVRHWTQIANSELSLMIQSHTITILTQRCAWGESNLIFIQHALALQRSCHHHLVRQVRFSTVRRKRYLVRGAERMQCESSPLIALKKSSYLLNLNSEL